VKSRSASNADQEVTTNQSSCSCQYMLALLINGGC
jgi:hypothetical protein